MRQFVPANESKEAAEKIMGSSEQREEYRKKYLAFQFAKSQGTVHHAETHIESTSKLSDVHEWTAFQIDKELGPNVGLHYRESGKIVPIPNRITGSTDPEHQLRPIPVAWTRGGSLDANTASLDHKREATADDISAVQSLGTGSASPGQVDGTLPQKVEVKAEQVPASEVKQAKIDKFTAGMGDTLLAVKGMAADLKMTYMTVEACKYGKEIGSDSNLLHGEVEKIVKAIEQILFGEKVTNHGIYGLIALIESVQGDYDAMVTIVAKHGYHNGGGENARPRNDATAWLR